MGLRNAAVRRALWVDSGDVVVWVRGLAMLVLAAVMVLLLVPNGACGAAGDDAAGYGRYGLS